MFIIHVHIKRYFILFLMFTLFRVLLFFIKKITQHIKMSIIKIKLAGVFFESKEIRQRHNIKNKVLNIQKNIKTDFNLDKLEGHKNYKKDDLFEQNNNSNINILHLYRINNREHITDKKLSKN